VLSACIFSVFLWAILNLLNNMPSFLMQRTIPEMIGISSYMLAFAFFESLLFFLIFFFILCLAAILLPKNLLGEHLSPVGAALAIVIGAIAMYVHYDYETVVALSTRRILFYLGLIGLAFLIYYLALLRFPKFEKGVRSIFQRVSVLSYIYAFFGVIGILIVIIRNVF
jgi:hypothetical protein